MFIKIMDESMVKSPFFFLRQSVADVIVVKDLTKKYGSLTAVNGVSFSVGHGEIFGLIQTFVTLPLFFLSGALFPVTHIPPWLKWVFYVTR
jgi:hypothetical protein